MNGVAPLCEYCPLNNSRSGASRLVLENLRENCAEIYYGDTNLEISDLADILVGDREADAVDAEMAVECLNKIYRNNCPTSVIGHIGANVLSVVARKNT